MGKSRLKHTHDRLPDWLDSAKMRASFMGGVTEAAMFQGGQATATRTREGAEAENLRRWELLRKERNVARGQTREAQAARDQLAQEKFTYRQAAPEREFEQMQKDEQWQHEQTQLRKQEEWTRRADAEEKVRAFLERERERGVPPERLVQLETTARIRYGAPKQKAPAPTKLQRFEVSGEWFTFDPATGGVAPIEGLPAEEPEGPKGADVKRYVDMAQKATMAALDQAQLLVFDEETKKLVIEKPPTHYEQIQFMESLWPMIESYYEMDPTLAEYTIGMAKQKLSKQNGEYLDRLYQQELVQPQQADTPAPTQPQQAPAPAQPMATRAAPTDPTTLAMSKAMGTTLTPEQEAIVAQSQVQPTTPVQSQAQTAVEKLKAQAQAGDPEAQAILKANGIPWQ